MSFITRQGRALLLTAAVAVMGLAVVLSGCGDDKGKNSDGGEDVFYLGNPCGQDGTAGSCKTVKIGKQTWMKENLNVATADSWCYQNMSNCVQFGRLYTWAAAKNVCQSIGWRLPDTTDWNMLEEAAGGWETARTTLGEKFGFYMPHGGGRINGGFVGLNGEGHWWSATEESDNKAYYRFVLAGRVYIDADAGYKSYGRSVRCVK